MNRYYRVFVRVVHGGLLAYGIVALAAIALVILLTLTVAD